MRKKYEPEILLLGRLKRHLILEHSFDDELLLEYLRAAIHYAEGYQHRAGGFYAQNPMPYTTAQGVVMLAAHYYESRDGSTAGFFGDNVQAGQNAMDSVHALLRLERVWSV
jgi:uncharacterized phage protein (predicted DNA packaging)